MYFWYTRQTPFHTYTPKRRCIDSCRGFKWIGRERAVLDFLAWFSEQPYTHKIFIAGNHDFYFESKSTIEIDKIIPNNVIYLNDSGCKIEGYNFWGSPITPEFYNWAFNRNRGADIRKHWNLIPEKTDVLITHGPPFGILDSTISGMQVGCENLLKTIDAIQPKVHVFGHIHEDYGLKERQYTTFINASSLDEDYQVKNKAIEIDI